MTSRTTSRARTLLQRAGKYWSKFTGQNKKHASAGVVLHDPGAQGPHDLDDPFFDPKVQARIGDAIASATQKK
jgi:hypothetical protein